MSTSSTLWTGPQTVDILNDSIVVTMSKDSFTVLESDGRDLRGFQDQTIVSADWGSSAFRTASRVSLAWVPTRTKETFRILFSAAISAQTPAPVNFNTEWLSTRKSTNGGVPHWHRAALDPEFYIGNVLWKDVLVPSSTDNDTVNSTGISSDWMVQLDGWTFTGAPGNETNSQGGPCSIDPCYPGIYDPLDLAQTMYDSVTNVVQVQVGYDTMSQTWTVPCDTKMSLFAKFGSELSKVDESVLVIQQGHNCVEPSRGGQTLALWGVISLGRDS